MSDAIWDNAVGCCVTGRAGVELRPLRLVSAAPHDDVEERTVGALSYPPPVTSPGGGMRRLDFGTLHGVLERHDLRFAVALVDTSNRISGRPVFEHLQWRPDQRFTGLFGRGCIALRPDRAGDAALDGRGRMTLPITLLHYCGIQAGEQAFLIASPQHQLLLVHPLSNLVRMARMFHSELHDSDPSPKDVRP